MTTKTTIRNVHLAIYSILGAAMMVSVIYGYNLRQENERINEQLSAKTVEISQLQTKHASEIDDKNKLVAEKEAEIQAKTKALSDLSIQVDSLSSKSEEISGKLKVLQELTQK